MSEQIAQGEPVGWQFYQNGQWSYGSELHNHRQNTEEAGIPVRDLYAAPQQQISNTMLINNSFVDNWLELGAPPSFKNVSTEDMQVALAYFSAALKPAVPEGYQLVPTIVTPSMIEAAESIEDLYKRGTPDTWGKVFRAMLAAAKEGE